MARRPFLLGLHVSLLIHRLGWASGLAAAILIAHGQVATSYGVFPIAETPLVDGAGAASLRGRQV